MTLAAADLAYFQRMGAHNDKFWRRLGMPDINAPGISVLDVGCGHGRLCVDVAQAGASRVVGVDLDADRIEFATENVAVNFPDLVDRVDFHCVDLKDFDESIKFDYILSKDSFEHIMDLESMLREIAKRLKPRGKLYCGFGPIYNSAYGGHGRLKVLPFWHFPWFHLVVPEHILLRRYNQRHDEQIGSIEDLGLNKNSLEEYRSLFAASGLETVSMKINCSERPVSRVFSLLRKLPFSEEFFSHNIYAVFTKPVVASDHDQASPERHRDQAIKVSESDRSVGRS